MAISNPIDGQGIVDRFEDLVTDVANTGIVWGINNKPFTEMPNANYSLESTILGQQNLTSGGSIAVTVPTGANAIHIISAVGGGGGGMSGAAYDKGGGESAGAGGGSGAYISDKVFSVTAGETMTFTVGSAGNGFTDTGFSAYNGTAGSGSTTSASGSTSGTLFSLTGGTGASASGGSTHGPLRSNTAGTGGTATISGTVRTSNTFVETDGTTININTLNGGPVGTFNQHGSGATGDNPGNCTTDNCLINGGDGADSYNGTIAGGTGGVAGSSNGGVGTRGSGGGGGGSQTTSGADGGEGEIRYRFLAVS